MPADMRTTSSDFSFVSLAGVLHNEVKVNSYWRGLPKVIHYTLSLPNYNKPDGYDYYAFSYSKLKLTQVTTYLKSLGEERSLCSSQLTKAWGYHLWFCKADFKHYYKVLRIEVLPVIKRCYFYNSQVTEQLAAMRYNDSHQRAVECIALRIEA